MDSQIDALRLMYTYRLVDQARHLDVRCVTCDTLTPLETEQETGLWGEPHYFLRLHCPECRYFVRMRVPREWSIMPAEMPVSQLVEALGSITQRAARRRASMSLIEALRRGGGSAQYDTDTRFCHVTPAYWPTGGEYLVKISGLGLDEEQWVPAGSLAEVLLILPLEHQIPTDTGWIPGTPNNRIRDLRSCQIGGDIR